jgi:hypothetical protein
MLSDSEASCMSDSKRIRSFAIAQDDKLISVITLLQ